MTLRATLGAIILAGGTLASAAASATIITFSGLGGPDGTPLTTYTEGGFTVTAPTTQLVPPPTFSTVFQDLSRGNPQPSLHVDPGPANAAGVDVTMNGGGLFNFALADVGLSPHFVEADYIGLLGGKEVFFEPGPFVGGAFFTQVNPSFGVAIDKLSIVFDGPANLDNIFVSAANVPGPIVGAGLPGLILACGALLALARRRRQRVA